MKLRHFLGRYAEKGMGKGAWTALDLAKEVGRAIPSDEGFKTTGRGPGSGPDATPYNVAKMLLAGLADVPCPGVPKALFQLYAAQIEGGDTGTGATVGGDAVDAPTDDLRLCPLTNAAAFGQAVEALLVEPIRAARVERIEVRRGFADASIYWRQGNEMQRSRFVSDHDRALIDALEQEGAFHAITAIGGAMLSKLANEMAGGL